MKVFSVYFKVIQKNLGQLSIYLFVFIFFALVLSNSGVNKTIAEFTQTKSRIAFINYDENEEFVDGFRTYLSQNAIIINIADDTEKLQDALFFRKVEYIVKIPKGFTQNFLSGKESNIEVTDVPGSTSSMYMDLLINKYLNTAKLYAKNINSINANQIAEYVSKDLSLKADLELKSYGGEAPKNSNIRYYFNYFAYTMFSILILAVTTIMIIFNDENIKRRNLCSPIKPGSMNTQLILGNLVFAVATWAIFVTLGLVIYGIGMINTNVIYMCINSFIFTLVCLSISFLIGSLIQSKNAQSAIANVLSLGLSFISGVFVPQELLGKTVLTISSFTPTYWYVKANNAIGSLSVYDYSNLSPIIYSMLIQLGFAIAMISVTLVVIKHKRVSA